MADIIVKPGEQIKPLLDLNQAVSLAEQLYGIKVEEAQELVGYDDKNYHLKVSEPINNKFITSLWPHGYVLKVMNSSDSKKLDCVEAQIEMMLHLGKKNPLVNCTLPMNTEDYKKNRSNDKHGIATPQPQKTREGKLYCLEKVSHRDTTGAEVSQEHVVRLLTYQDGTLMKDIQWSYPLHYQVGRYSAQLDVILQDFSHPAYKHYSSLWMLKNVPNIKDYLFVVNDESKASLVKDVIIAFEENVLSRFDSLTLGMIHGDIHDQNLVCKQDGAREWYISAVLDLGDSQFSAYIVELALVMTYMMLVSGELQSGSHVVAGYCSLHPLPLDELRLLKVCVCARLCQSLVLGLYTHSQHPDNQYVLSTQAPGWTLLQKIWAIDSAQLYDLWTNALPTNKQAET